ncbi:MAG: zinc-ribbon domain-containing protein [Muribaculaceae bacterium]
MGNIVCKNCGKEVAEGSRFCNHCGAAMPQAMHCPYCQAVIPQGSHFCPECGRQIATPIPAPKPAVTPSQTNEEGWDFNKEDEEQEEQASQNSTNYNYDLPERRNHSAGPIVAAVVTALILVVAGYFFFKHRYDTTTTVVENVDVPISNEEAVEILRNTLNNENRLGDLANVAFAVEVAPDKNGHKQIAGVSYYSSTNTRSFYKVFTITHDSITATWRVTYELNRSVENRQLTFDATEVMGSANKMPQLVTHIDGRNYVFFAYGALPQLNCNTGEVVMALYNPQNSELQTLTYAGELVQRDGHKMVYGKEPNMQPTPENQFMAQQAQEAALIYHPTSEELELEKAENATKRWAVENQDNVMALRGGAIDVRMTVPVYDKPIFALTATEGGVSIEDDNLIILADAAGAVFGFSKTKRIYFVVYAPAEPQARADIEFTHDGLIDVKADSNLEFVFNPRTCCASAVTSLE